MNPIYLNEDESFSLTANVTSPGYQRIALKGYLVSRGNDGVYIAPLIPQLFYGADGTQLQTWRQNLTQTGSQVILSRAAGGYPEVPKEELYWRKVSDFEVEKKKEEAIQPVTLQLPWLQIGIAISLFSGLAIALYYLSRRK